MHRKRHFFIALLLSAFFLIAGRSIGDYFIIQGDVEDEIQSAVAYNKTNQQYLVVWYNDRPGNDDIRAKRLDRAGNLLGGAFYIAAGAGADRRYPDVAYNPQQNEYLVVWEHYDGLWYNIYGRRVASDGQVLGMSDIVIASGSNISTPTKPAVAYAETSDSYLVVWQEAFHPTVTTDILGQVLTSIGALDGTDFTISADPVGHPRREPDLAYNHSRNEFLVVYELEDGDYDIYGRRVTAGGMPLQPDNIEIGRANVDELTPSVAGMPTIPNRGQYLVVWELRFSGSDGDIYANLVDGDGTAGTSFAIAAESTDQYHPAVAASEGGQEYLVAWAQAAPNMFTDIHLQAISMFGAETGQELPLRGGDSYPDYPALTDGWLGDFLVVWQDTPVTPDGDIYGNLWGNRAYLPVGLRNYE